MIGEFNRFDRVNFLPLEIQKASLAHADNIYTRYKYIFYPTSRKKGDRKNLKNWRPISLLNVDYKICSKVLSLRLSKVLEFIVDPEQTCSVPLIKRKPLIVLIAPFC